MAKQKSMKKKRLIGDVATHALLAVLSIIWVFPIFWIVMISFDGKSGAYHPYFFPKEWGLQNYTSLFTDTNVFNFPKVYMNTLVVAICSCIVSTFFVLAVAYVLSKMRFKMRKPMMNVALILGMFPGFMSMIAVYYILKGLNMTQSLVSLVIVYAAGSGLTYYIAKGFFDTIPKAIDEAAFIDGASRFQVFRKITVPLSKPIIIYTILTSFTAPWLDFIFARVVMGDKKENYTVAVAMWMMLDKEYVDIWFNRFAAAAVLVSIPIALIFVVCQKYYVEGLSGSVKG